MLIKVHFESQLDDLIQPCNRRITESTVRGLFERTRFESPVETEPEYVVGQSRAIDDHLAGLDGASLGVWLQVSLQMGDAHLESVLGWPL